MMLMFFLGGQGVGRFMGMVMMGWWLGGGGRGGKECCLDMKRRRKKKREKWREERYKYCFPEVGLGQ